MWNVIESFGANKWKGNDYREVIWSNVYPLSDLAMHIFWVKRDFFGRRLNITDRHTYPNGTKQEGRPENSALWVAIFIFLPSGRIICKNEELNTTQAYHQRPGKLHKAPPGLFLHDPLIK